VIRGVSWGCGRKGRWKCGLNMQGGIEKGVYNLGKCANISGYYLVSLSTCGTSPPGRATSLVSGINRLISQTGGRPSPEPLHPQGTRRDEQLRWNGRQNIWSEWLGLNVGPLRLLQDLWATCHGDILSGYHDEMLCSGRLRQVLRLLTPYLCTSTWAKRYQGPWSLYSLFFSFL